MMEKGRFIRCFDYVNQPYPRVRQALTGNALEIFQKATKVAEARAGDVASELRVQLGSIEIGTDIAISVRGVEEAPGLRSWDQATKLLLEWQSAKSPRWF